MTIKNIIPIFILLFASQLTLFSQVKKELDSKAVSVLLQNDKTVKVLDVRTPAEFHNGHLKNALNYDIRDSIAFCKIDLLDHNQNYIVHCRTNHRSTKAVEYLIKHGFKNLYQMMDGYTGWESNKLEIEK